MIDYQSYLGFQSADNCMTILKSKQGIKRTASLFIETIRKPAALTLEPLYAMGDVEKKGKPSAYQIYMASTDEYDAAMKLVGSMRHWRKLCELDWFMNGTAKFDGLATWRSDMKLRDASKAKRQLMTAAKKDTGAARKIIDMSTDKATKPPGRPKEEKEKPVDPTISRLAKLHKQTLGQDEQTEERS